MAYFYSLEDKEKRELLKAGIADTGEGGEQSLFNRTDKIELDHNEKSLIIGIGGTGYKIVNRIKRYLKIRLVRIYRCIEVHCKTELEWSTVISKLQS